MKKLRVLGMCAAQGVMLFPFHLDREKFRVIGNIEPRGVFHSKGEEQWRLNFGEIPFEKKLESFKKKRVDIVVGSPSCGHSSAFSYSRKKSLGKPKEDPTLNLFLQGVKKFQPKIWAMENLPKLLDLVPLPEWQELFPDYTLIPQCHSVADFGNSQVSRKRLLLIGVRKDLGDSIPEYFKQARRVATPHKCQTIRRMVRRELNFKESMFKKLAMYDARKLPEKKSLTVGQVRKLWRTDFKDQYKWPMPGTRMKTLPGVYRNRWEAFPLTLRPSNRQFNPAGTIMGLEEFRIIMGIPESFNMYMPEGLKKCNKMYNYWLNKGRNTLSKGAVYQTQVWLKEQIDFIRWDKIPY